MTEAAAVFERLGQAQIHAAHCLSRSDCFLVYCNQIESQNSWVTVFTAPPAE